MNRDKFKEGMTLFEQGKFFEAHEAWEEIWLPDRNSESGRMLKGLILYAASCLKQRQGQMKPAIRLARSALEKLEGLDRPAAQQWGLDVDAWLNTIKTFLATSSSR